MQSPSRQRDSHISTIRYVAGSAVRLWALLLIEPQVLPVLHPATTSVIDLTEEEGSGRGQVHMEQQTDPGGVSVIDLTVSDDDKD